jgi:hypothetical protein
VALFAGGWFARGSTSPTVPAGGGARVVAFTGQGELQVAYRPGVAGAYLFGSRLPAPGPGRVLEVWMIRGRSVTPGACLSPAGDGSLAAFLDADLGGTEQMAVTAEPSSCPDAPTSKPILTARLPSSPTA